MTHGKEVADRFALAKPGGIPWMVIVDGKGEVLATSEGADGNIGYPYKPAEIDHFLGMLKSTKKRLNDGDLEAIRTALEKYRAEREQRLREKEANDAAKKADTESAAGN
jgi:hypothetical protein